MRGVSARAVELVWPLLTHPSPSDLSSNDCAQGTDGRQTTFRIAVLDGACSRLGWRLVFRP